MITNGRQIDLYRKAQELVKKTHDFYGENAGEVDQSQKAIFLKIGDDEQKHINTVENHH